MSKKHFKQHIIPKTYLKHFSINEDGNALYVIDNHDEYKRKIQIKNSGDKIFWEKKFYNSIQFSSATILEEILSSIESLYNKLMLRLKSDMEIEDLDTKLNLITWIFSAIQRTPQKRFNYRRMLDLNIWLKRVYPDLDDLPSIEGTDLDNLAKELHLREFADESIRSKKLEEFTSFAMNKRWEILKCPYGSYWITTDNPGFLIKFNEIENSLVCNPSWNFSSADGMFFPLSKDYAIHIFPYSKTDDVKLNLTNTPIERRVAPVEINRLYNRFSFVSIHRVLISPNEETLLELAKDIKQISNPN